MTSLYDRLGGREGILTLLQPFYADIRQHDLLGPIFNATIGDWSKHLERITEFWSRQTGGPSTYDGGFAGAHLRLGIPPDLVSEWLNLWDFNCARQLREPESSEMSALAHRLGENLQRILSGSGGLVPSRLRRSPGGGGSGHLQ